MKAFRIFHPDADTVARMDACYNSIKSKLLSRYGISDYMEKDGWIAFAGSAEKPELVLTVSVTESGGKCYLCADVDDEVSWWEWDHENREAFENAIVAHIGSMAGRTVKTVTEKKRFACIKLSRYYLKDDGEWALLEEDTVDFLPVRLFLFRNTVKEEIKSYQLKK